MDDSKVWPGDCLVLRKYVPGGIRKLVKRILIAAKDLLICQYNVRYCHILEPKIEIRFT